MGGALLQKVDRDTQKFAFKCSYAEINGKGIDVQKHPLEIDGRGKMIKSFKTSKAGKLKLIQTNEGYKTVRQNEAPDYDDQLITVFENGKLYNETTFENVRDIASRKINDNVKQP